ncbi:MAG: SAM-dependent methyltransferase [Flavobacteriales bacterium]|jgi:16S rRNA (cytidine1402-2'-O)-methyltransferase|nr:SAM-dependent methyltransferase [Flavobacteriales bacterium]
MTKGKLYLIPTTLGNETEEQTLPPTILDSIKNIDIFIVENIRTSRRFIKRMYKEKDIDNTLFYSYGKHDKIDLQEEFLPHIYNGKDVGIISEAGLPCVADPGNKIVDFAHKFQVDVVPLVGPSSIFLALMASGFNGQNFAFNGYLPIDKSERSRKIKDLEILSRKSNQTQIFMETPYRNLQLFESILKVCSKSTKLCVASNITLDSENIKTKTIEEWKSSNPPNIHKSPTIFLIYLE